MTDRKAVDYSKLEFSPAEKELIRKEVDLIKHKYPDYIPVVLRTKDTSLQSSKNKFLVTGDVTIGQFMHIIRRRLDKKLKPTQALYIFANNCIPPSSCLLSAVYISELDKETGMLFLTVCQENTFG
uniref:Autophagy-related protein n=1 Tax=viral metagenome TaxID=1070528 RepID=A0A6C0H7R2_9ZZZZ